MPALPVPPGRILLVRLGAVGDCLRVMPSLVRLRRAFPHARIGWVVEDLAAPLLRGHPALDELHVVRRRGATGGGRKGDSPGGSAGPSAPASASGTLRQWVDAAQELRRVGAELAAAQYDMAIDFHTRLKSGYLTRASAARYRIGIDRRSGTEANFLFTNVHVSLRDCYENRVLQFGRLLAPLGIYGDPDAGDLRPWVDPEAAAKARSIAAAAGRPAVAVFAGTSASRAHDRWPLPKWCDAVRRLGDAGLTSMVLWGPGDHDAAAAIAAASPLSSLAPPTTLPEMMALLGSFRLYVGSNTAALHMAWMQGVPSVVLAGGRPWRTDRPLAPTLSETLSAGGVEPDRKLRGEAARQAVAAIEVDEVVAAALRLAQATTGAGTAMDWSARSA